MKTIIHRARKIRAGVLALALIGGATAGCGQTSYFEVTVNADMANPKVTTACLFSVGYCVVTVSGAASDHFGLNDKACDKPASFNLGLFRYATDQDSGTVNFLVEIQDTNHKAAGQGSISGSINAGGRKILTVSVTPDATALGCI